MKKNEKVGCIIISENTSFIPEIIDDTKDYISFDATLQEVDRVNRNTRAYGPQLKNSLTTPHMKEKLRTKNFVGECGHPMTTGNNELDAKRQMYIDFENVSHIVTDINFNGNLIEGTVETYNGLRGPDMMGAIRQGVQVGFSLRALGNISSTRNGVKRVDDEILIISYDWVLFPSYPNAYMKTTALDTGNKMNINNKVNTPDLIGSSIVQESFINFDIQLMLEEMIQKSDNYNLINEAVNVDLNKGFTLGSDKKLYLKEENDNHIICFLEKSLTEDIDSFLISF